MKTIIKCPVCGRDLIKMVNLSASEPEKYYCPRCGGTWYEHDVAVKKQNIKIPYDKAEKILAIARKLAKVFESYPMNKEPIVIDIEPIEEENSCVRIPEDIRFVSVKKGNAILELTEDELSYLQEALVESRVGWVEREGNPYSFEPEDWMQELLDKIEHARDMLDIKRMKEDGVK